MKTRVLFSVVLLLYTCFLFGQTKRINQKWQEEAISALEKSQYNFSDVSGGKGAANVASAFRVKILPGKQFVESLNGSNDLNYSFLLKSIHKGNHYLVPDANPFYETNTGHLTEKHKEFEIEYLNTEKGLKQNFILEHKIQNSNKLIVDLSFESKNCFVTLEKNEIQIKNGLSKKIVASYTGLLVYDANKTIVPSRFILSNNSIQIEVNDVDAIYPLTIDPISSTPSTLSTGSVNNAQMGYCVSGAGDVNGDGFSDIIVGAPRYANGQINEGAIFVYHGSATGIGASPNTTIEGNIALPASFPVFPAAGYDLYFTSVLGFGTSVSEAGDVNGDGFGDVIVGHPYLTNGNNGEGKAFVYLGAAGGISTSAAWTYENNIDSSHVGFSVSSAGDVNGDGFSDVIVGAPRRTNGQRYEGMAYVFHGSAGGLSLAPNATIEENSADSWLGWSVSVAGDVNGDTYDDVVVTAAYHDGGQANEGKAYVYHGSAGGIVTVANWTGESNLAEAYYGENASWAGDVNGDGYADLIVGADYYDNGSTDEGRAYIYHGSASGLAAGAAITLEPNIANAFFGVAVNGAGDVNGDGYGDVVIGAYGFASGHSGEGATYVYYGSSGGIMATGSTLIQADKISTSMGISVAGCGDVNGDGFSDIVSGAYLYDRVTPSALTNSGAIYVFHGLSEGIGTTTIPAAPYTLSEATANLGEFVTTIGDVNADGFSDMAVGARLLNNGGTDRGVVYIFHGSAAGYGASPTLTLNGPAVNSSFFGCSIGAAGDVNGDGYSDIIVGANGYNNGGAGTLNEGAAFIYLGSAGGINTTIHLQLEGNSLSAFFGYSVAGAGDVNGDGYSDVIIGAKTMNSGTAGEGKAFVYHGSSTGIDGTVDWTYETNSANENFGACVAGVGDCNGDGYSDVLVLSSGWSSGQTNEGRYHYFRGSSTGLELGVGTVNETNVASAGLDRNSTSYMGDLNGDGYNDIVIGIGSYNVGGTANEGALWITFGNYPSLFFGTSQTIESNTLNFYLGTTVGFGGDVNGDGYNDIITGGPAFANGQATEGIARVYIGGPGTSLATTPYFSLESNVAATSFGSSVSSGGDANADGFSDIVVGAMNFDNVGADAGRIFVYMGNNSHSSTIANKSWITQQYRSTFAQVVQTSNGTFELGCSFGVRHSDKHYLGRGRGKQAYEFKGHPNPFNNYAAAMASSVTLSGQEASFTDLGLAGAQMSPGITAAGIGFPKWRTRTKFHMIDALDGQIYGRWYYGGIHDKHDRSIKINITCGVLPVEVTSVETECIHEKTRLTFKIMAEENVAQYNILASEHGIDFDFLNTVFPDNSGVYEIEIPENSEYNYIRLSVIDINGYPNDFDRKIQYCYQEQNVLTVYPNPSNQLLNLKLDNYEDILEEVCIIDLAAKTVYKTNKYTGSIDVSMLPPGIYYVIANTKSGKKYSNKFSHL